MPARIIPRDRQYIHERVTVEDRGHTSPCWIWQLGVDRGYGDCTLGGRHIKAHRVAYVAFVGPIPDGLHIDHLCRVRACCNPDHLEAVTCAENNRRSMPYRHRKTHCECGAELTPEVRSNRRTAQCKPCWAAYMRNWNAARIARGFNPYYRTRERLNRHNARRRAAYARRVG